MATPPPADPYTTDWFWLAIVLAGAVGAFLNQLLWLVTDRVKVFLDRKQAAKDAKAERIRELARTLLDLVNGLLVSASDWGRGFEGESVAKTLEIRGLETGITQLLDSGDQTTLGPLIDALLGNEARESKDVAKETGGDLVKYLVKL
jgi:hypothetical protein